MSVFRPGGKFPREIPLRNSLGNPPGKDWCAGAVQGGKCVSSFRGASVPGGDRPIRGRGDKCSRGEVYVV